MPASEKLTKLLLSLKGFDKALHAMKILSAGNGSITAELKLTEEHLNRIGTLHGGLAATIVDVISSMGLLSHKDGNKPAIPLTMDLSYLGSAKLDDVIEIVGKTSKVKENFAFLHVEIKNRETGAIIVKSLHTKSLFNNLKI